MNYYNDFEPYACEWMTNLIQAGLIPQGTVDGRSILEIKADELRDYRQWHLFSGVAGWSTALRIAGWPEDRPILTASLPCQPFSAAGKRRGKSDERHLWPVAFNLIRELKPPVVIGEQVASKDGLEWLDGVFADLETEDYACWAADLCAPGCRAPHIRQRLFWGAERLANTSQQSSQWRAGGLSTQEAGERGADRPKHGDLHQRFADDGESGGLANTHQHELQGKPGARQQPVYEQGGGIERLGHTSSPRLEERISHRGVQPGEVGAHPRQGAQRSSFLLCRDGKARRIEPGLSPLAHAIPRSARSIESRLQELGHSAADSKRIVREARRARTGQIKGYGNAIVPTLAAEFIRMSPISDRLSP